jgi:hypothetical protein
VRHTKGCPKCARGEGHAVSVLTVTYPGGRTQQISVRRRPSLRARRTGVKRVADAREGAGRVVVYENLPHARSVAHQMSPLPLITRMPNTIHP